MNVRIICFAFIFHFPVLAMGQTFDRFDNSVNRYNPIQQKIAREAVSRVALVLADSGRCSGALVGIDLVLTAWHCVERVREQKVTFRGLDQAFRSHVVAFDRMHDLAVIRLDRPVDLTPLPLLPAAANLTSGEPLITIGHPESGLYRVSVGRAIEPGLDFFLFNAEVSFGNSGGPILKESGEIVGVAIIVNRFIGDRQLGDAAAAGPIRDIVERAQARERVSWREASGSWGFNLGYGRDTLQLSFQDKESAAFVYALGYDFYDRWRVTFRHTILRPDRIRGFETGPVFKFLIGRPAFLIGRNFYDRSVDEIAVNKIGIAFEFWWFNISLFHLNYGEQKYSALTVAF